MSYQMYIPEIGDKIQLTEAWSFALYSEYRNKQLFDVIKKHDPKLEKVKKISVPAYKTSWNLGLKTAIKQIPGYQYI